MARLLLAAVLAVEVGLGVLAVPAGVGAAPQGPLGPLNLDKPLNLTADEVTVDDTGTGLVARGHVVVTYGPDRATADLLRLNRAARTAELTGRVQITDPKAHRTEPRDQISIGGKTPSVDASDPMGGSSGPVYRDSLEIDFALFRAGTPTAVTNATLLEQPSANVSDSLVQAMDRAANRVHHELKKK